MSTHVLAREPFTLAHLNPQMMAATLELTKITNTRRFALGGRGYVVKPFEGFRHPARQNELIATKATKARSWQSAHQYGLAVDFACRWIEDGGVLGAWFWPDPDQPVWWQLKRDATSVGLAIPIKWDYGHVQHPLFDRIMDIMDQREWNWVA